MEIVSIGQKYLQKHMYLPMKVFKALDMTRGKCNLEALMVLWSIETNAMDPYKDTSKNKPDAVLPHKWQICEVARVTHMHANNLLPMKHLIGQHGEGC